MGFDSRIGKARNTAKRALDIGSETRRQAEAGKVRQAEHAAWKQAQDVDRNGPMESIRRDDTKT